MKMHIRKSTFEDFPILMKLYEHARAFMAQHGNPSQWGTSYPPASKIEQDIRDGHSYVCVKDDQIVGTFYFHIGKDDTYAKIYEGQWLNDEPYGVVHRITSDGSHKGIATFCVDWALQQCGNLRIDTHKNNYIMQNFLEKNHFQYCGIIYVEDGTERIAYQRKN